MSFNHSFNNLLTEHNSSYKEGKLSMSCLACGWNEFRKEVKLSQVLSIPTEANFWEACNKMIQIRVIYIYKKSWRKNNSKRNLKKEKI